MKKEFLFFQGGSEDYS